MNKGEIALFAYEGDFVNFKKHYNAELHTDFMSGCICNGIVKNLQFCFDIKNSDITLPDFVNKVIQSKLIMNDIIELEEISKYKPFCIWYPEVPSKDTCIELANKFEFLNYSISIVSILMNWEDVYRMCGSISDSFLYGLGVRTTRTWVNKSEMTKVFLHAEEIREKEIRESYDDYEITDCFQFGPQAALPSIFKLYRHDEYSYRYPLGLQCLLYWGVDNHIINMSNKTYIYDEEAPCEKSYFSDWSDDYQYC